jgi:quercetin dioxygenase-like cupin family protein
VKRHAALIQFSHDHHHGLVEAKRLRRAAIAGDAERRDAVSAFLAFFDRDTRSHFRDEEERLFPLLVGAGEPATELLTRALLEHQEIHALVRDLDGAPAGMRRLGELLEEHIRFEERALFPLIEEIASESDLRRLENVGSGRTPVGRGGPIWGTETEDLNATLLAWPPGSGPPEHVNAQRDVLLVVLEGSASVAIDGVERRLASGEVLVVDKGSSRRISAGPSGVRYLAVHLRRSPLQISSAPASP